MLIFKCVQYAKVYLFTYFVCYLLLCLFFYIYFHFDSLWENFAIALSYLLMLSVTHD